MAMLNEHGIVDLIERAHARQPYCECGRHTTTIYRDGAVWLDCSALAEPLRGKIHRVWKAVTDGAHVHRKIVDLATADAELAA